MKNIKEELEDVFGYVGFGEWVLDITYDTEGTGATIILSKEFNTKEPKQFLGQLDNSLINSEYTKEREMEFQGKLMDLDTKLKAAQLELETLRKYKDHFELEMLLKHGYTFNRGNDNV